MREAWVEVKVSAAGEKVTLFESNTELGILT